MALKATLGFALLACALTGCKRQTSADMMQRAELALEMNDDTAALNAFSAIIHARDVSQSDRIHAYLMRAHIYARGHGYALALGQYNYALKLAPDRTEIYSARGLTRAFLGDLKGALEDYNIALNARPDDALTLRQRADVLFDSGHIAEALNDYDATLKAFPDDALALAHRALARARLNQAKGARDDAQKAVTLAAGESWPQLINIQILSDTGASKDALKALDDMLVRDPQNARALHWRAWLNISLKNFSDAEKDLDAALKFTPDDPGLHMTRAELYEQRGDKTHAIAELGAAIPKLNDDARAEALFQRAGLYFDVKDYKAAVSDYTAVLALKPNDPVTLNNRCWTEAEQGKLAAARNDCEEAVRLAPDQAFIAHSLAAVLEKLGEFDEAAKYYRKAATLEPNNAQLVYDAVRSAQPNFASQNAVKVNVDGDTNANRPTNP